MAKDLRTFIDQVVKERPDDLYRVEREVDPRLELTGVISKLEDQGRYPAVHFERVKGSKIPVMCNVMAAYERLALSLETDLEHMVEEYARREASPIPMKEIPAKNAPVREVILTGSDAQLALLPIPVHNELDSAPYISSGLAIVKDPDSGRQNVGIYRHEVQGPQQLGCYFDPAHHAYHVWKKWSERGKETDCAIAIGHHPAVVMGSVSRLLGIGGEFEVAGGLCGEPVEVVRGETVDLLVPAWAEIVVEGKVVPNEERYEGPFGEWPGYYSGEGPKPYMRVTAITMRKDAIYQDIFAAHAEHRVAGGLPRMGSVFRMVKGACPNVRAINMPMSGCARAACYISIKKLADGEPNKAGMAALITENDLKLIIVVDDDINVFNEQEVLWALATRFEADRDMVVLPNTLGLQLIPTAYDYTRIGHGRMNTKLILDATRPAPPAKFPKRAVVPKEITDQINLEQYLKRYVG
ncbi:MAG: UbiD family decarboxylase [Deltaproteobacteria bacterium]|nr:UbiD family decarboxylase [Deltaproteobacteria bacterium]